MFGQMNMELMAILIFVISLISNEISSTLGFQSLVGHIQMFKKHPKVRECSELLLRKSYYVDDTDNVDTRYIGGRVSIPDGQCEGLLRGFNFNETALSGFAYFKYIGVKEEHDPPIVVNDVLQRAIPVEFRAGIKVTVTFRTQEKIRTILIVELDDVYRLFFQNSYVELINRRDGRLVQDSFVVDTTKKSELSFKGETNEIRVHVNDVQIGIFPVNTHWSRVEFLTITKFNIDNAINNDMFIHSINIE